MVGPNFSWCSRALFKVPSFCSGTPIHRSAKELANCVLYNGGSLYRSSFSYMWDEEYGSLYLGRFYIRVRCIGSESGLQ